MTNKAPADTGATAGVALPDIWKSTPISPGKVRTSHLRPHTRTRTWRHCMSHLDIEPLHPGFGARIAGPDLTATLSDEDMEGDTGGDRYLLPALLPRSADDRRSPPRVHPARRRASRRRSTSPWARPARWSGSAPSATSPTTAASRTARTPVPATSAATSCGTPIPPSGKYPPSSPSPTPTRCREKEEGLGSRACATPTPGCRRTCGRRSAPSTRSTTTSSPAARSRRWTPITPPPCHPSSTSSCGRTRGTA